MLGEKIMMLRKQQGWSQEELANRLDVTRQSVSKWESGMSVPELEKIIRLSEVFDVTTDFLLREEGEMLPAQEVPQEPVEQEPEKVRCVDREEAEVFLELSMRSSGKIALGVMLCILSPVLLIVLCGISEYYGNAGITEDFASGIGVSVLLVMIASAVALFITFGMKLERFEYLEQERILLHPDMVPVVGRQKEAYEPTYRCAMVVGVGLCILAAVPLILVGAFHGSDMAVIWCVALLLAIISVAVYLFVRCETVWESFQKLLEEGDYTREKKKLRKKNRFLPPIYWCTVTALFLGYSFITSDWGRSWIIWPIAGVLYATVEAIAAVVRK